MVGEVAIDGNQRGLLCYRKGEHANVTPFTLEAPLMRLSVRSLRRVVKGDLPICRCSMKMSPRNCSVKMSPRYGDLHDEQEGSASGGPRKSRVGGEDHQRRGSRSLASDGAAVQTSQGARSHGGCGRVAASCAGPPGPASPRRRPPGTGLDAHDDCL